VSDALLGTPDLMPTILSMMELPVPKTVEGVDLSAQAMGHGGDGPAAAHLQGMGTTAAWADGAEWRAVRDREYTYAIYHRDRKELLFQHRTDPYQMTDLAGDRSHTATLEHYRETSEAWRKEQNDTFETCSYYERWTTDRNITMTAKGVSQNLDTLKKITDKWFANGVGDRNVESLPVGVL
jgi:arylsulfatase A-like enzyme